MQMFLENKSKFNFDETVEQLTQAITSKSWNVVMVLDMQQTMTKFDKSVLPVKVFAICQPTHAFKILSNDEERIISSMMPCRLSVYEKSDGATYISRINSSALSSNFDGLIKDVMCQSGNEVEEIIKLIL